MINRTQKITGYTLIELLLAVVLASILMLGLSGIANIATQTYKTVHEQNNLSRQARFAMQRMVRAVSNTRLLLLPLNDVPSTNWLENVREETVPPTTPTDDSTKYTAVLAVTLPLYSNLDGDDFPDADDDKDGKVDEDLPNDWNNDSAPGIYLIDDDGDGSVDEGTSDDDDDERNSSANEDPINGIDDDGDNNVDEDPGSDMNGDSCPGICGVDDDGDGDVDEGSADNDDESGGSNEDWYNPVVFYLDNGILRERTPVPWNENGTGGITGQDFITSDIAENVTRFRVERIPVGSNRAQLVDLTLELTSSVTGKTVSLHTQARVGGGL
jgi:prepilin-type N-terminal cleavage/methylation domain-containing protein